jgi:hypothetical protein
VYPFKFKDTYDRSDTNPGSTSESNSNPVEEGAPVIIDNDCISWQCSSSKSSHISGLELTLLATNRKYTAFITPEDWIIFWAFNDYASYLQVLKAVKEGKRANQFKNAPKFVGRVASIFKDKRVEPNTGRKEITYSLSAKGFTELDSKIYYNSGIGINYKSVQSLWADFGNLANQFITQGNVKTQDAIPKLLRICLGLGPGVKFKGVDTSNLEDVLSPEIQKSAATIKTSPNEAYMIPQSVANLLLSTGENRQKNISYTYADLLKLFIGVQSYRGFGVSKSNDTDESGKNWTGFVPDSNELLPKIYKSADLTGEFAPQPVNFNNTPVWSVLSNYLNEPINEMYSCLRVDETGHVVPTVICRQVPFSSKKFANSGNQATSFLDLPRWEIDDRLIVHHRSGRSNAMRFNYLQIVGANPIGTGSVLGQAADYVNFKPIVDSADIKRAGLNTYIKNCNSFYVPAAKTNGDDGRFWSKLMADMLFGSHLKFTGTAVVQGIQEPICEGDNCVIDGIIYHIERVVHSGSIDAMGRKEFNTILSLTNGISVKSDNSEDIVYPDNDEEDPHVGSNFEVI